MIKIILLLLLLMTPGTKADSTLQNGEWTNIGADPSLLLTGIAPSTRENLKNLLIKEFHPENPDELVERIANGDWDAVGLLSKYSFNTNIPDLQFDSSCFGLSHGTDMKYTRCARLGIDTKLSANIIAFKTKNGQIRWLAVFTKCGNIGLLNSIDAAKEKQYQTVPIPPTAFLILLGAAAMFRFQKPNDRR